MGLETTIHVYLFEHDKEFDRLLSANDLEKIVERARSLRQEGKAHLIRSFAKCEGEDCGILVVDRPEPKFDKSKK